VRVRRLSRSMHQRSRSSLQRLADVAQPTFVSQRRTEDTLKGAALYVLEKLDVKPASSPAHEIIRPNPLRRRAYAAAVQTTAGKNSPNNSKHGLLIRYEPVIPVRGGNFPIQTQIMRFLSGTGFSGIGWRNGRGRGFLEPSQRRGIARFSFLLAPQGSWRGDSSHFNSISTHKLWLGEPQPAAIHSVP